MIPVLGVHLGVGLLLLAAAVPLRRVAFGLAALPALASLAFAASIGGDVLDGDPWRTSVTWVGGLDLAIDLRIDAFGLLMIGVVSGIGVAIAAFGGGYFSATAAAARTAGLLVLFAGAMLGLVTAEHVVALYVFWELTSILSWQLIGQKYTDPEARASATHALFLTAAGGLALLGGLIVLAQAAGTWSLSEILADPPSGGPLTGGLVLVLIGIATKSAQYPTHAWLPGAMVAPTPVSAYLHSATMVKAGIYLAVRFGPAVAALGFWRPAVLTIGLVTMVAGGLRAVRQHDLKLLLAMGTVSQLGFLLVLTGVGYEDATVAGITLLLAHAVFKATLFIVVGIVDHQAHTRDRRALLARGFGTGWTPLRIGAVLTAASMAGIPPLFGFIAKEEAYDAFLHVDGATGTVGLVGIVMGSLLTMAYSLRFASAFWPRLAVGDDRPTSERDRRESGPIEDAPTPGLLAPVAVLTTLSLLAGIIPNAVFGTIVDQAAGSVLGEPVKAKLAIWHGFNAALALSVLTVLGGIVLHLANRPLVAATGRLAPRRDGRANFDAGLAGLYTLSKRITGVVQNGSLPRSAAIILLTVVGGPALLAAATVPLPALPNPFELPAHVLLATAILGSATASAIVRRRLAAVVVLGGAGYGMAGLFVAQGAPDLALTQFAIETLTIVAFVLVLRTLPADFSRTDSRAGLVGRITASVAVATGVFVLALAVTGEDPDPVAATLALEQARPEAGGRNVVNVILVDFRGLDTLGEITVLLVAAVGVTTLARIGRRPRAGIDDDLNHTLTRRDEARP